MNKVFLFFALVALSLPVFSQDDEVPTRWDVGVGIGLNYGGIGAKASWSPYPYFNFFGSLGYAELGAGYSFGGSLYVMSKNDSNFYRPCFIAMFGTNAMLHINNNKDKSKLYSGPSIGFGNEFRFGKKKKHGFDLDFFYTLLNETYSYDLDKVKNMPGRKIPYDFGGSFYASFSYHFEFN